ncbi:MAG: methylenetetrahydrofolate reductase [Thermodesulfovibrionales bacterium]|nr:methylenetetrahydrofolate reductase [Thermodesulfovibrionales bacterium]
MKVGSNLEKVILSGSPVVTVELGPPMSADATGFIKKANLLKGFCDAVNITDCQTAIVRMSSIAGSLIVMKEGLEPVMQMTCRDRNRIAIQSDLLGASALGIRNCLCIAGDHQRFSGLGRFKGHPGAKNVYDIDTCQLVGIIKRMRDDGLQQGGDRLEVAPRLFIGASWTPTAEPLDFRPINLKKKVLSGADFIQTQGIFDIDLFKQQMQTIRAMGLHEKTAILAGIIVPRSYNMLKYMATSVPGITIPEKIIHRMLKAKESAGSDKEEIKRRQEQEGLKIAMELIHQVLEIDGVRGIHLQTISWEEVVGYIIKTCGLYPRPKIHS